MKTAVLCLLTGSMLLLVLAACQPAAPDVVQSSLTPAPGSTENPPLIPHEVPADGTGEDCLICHRGGDDGATKTPHPWLVDCQQCHIAQDESVKPFTPAY